MTLRRSRFSLSKSDICCRDESSSADEVDVDEDREASRSESEFFASSMSPNYKHTYKRE